MPDPIGTIKGISELIKKYNDIELMKRIVDLQTEVFELQQENLSLKAKVAELESVEGEKCPKCHKLGWQLVASNPDPVFGEVGGRRRTYKCSSCGFSESVLLTTPDAGRGRRST